jgi:hypothetical protein
MSEVSQEAITVSSRQIRIPGGVGATATIREVSLLVSKSKWRESMKDMGYVVIWRHKNSI